MLSKIATALVALTGLAAAPALANETTVGVAASAGASTASGGVDTEFSELFANWQTLETGGRVTQSGDIMAGPSIAISVPSRMPLENAVLTSGYGMRNHPILRQRRGHKGVDLAAPTGTPVYATADGMVGMAQPFSSYGNYVQIEHGGAMQTRYAHLSSYVVNVGDNVQKGDLIGYVGSTGRSTGPHLHYEVRVAGEAVNPIPYMTAELAIDNSPLAARGGPE
ncbi:M23 family peptidase [Aurantiacibacter xanthus]|uniref:M23 family peptidase n=1 Tax=Aurantiacibacter xanthus TaxID=1784712 RepID=A0A3A1P3W4_9SPHN|nr:M23 family metallopeptidase [Aurantiacibacter xanthus]RIV83485.1 M23 family peptidase [Aurantiacibacter xanthus]